VVPLVSHQKASSRPFGIDALGGRGDSRQARDLLDGHGQDDASGDEDRLIVDYLAVEAPR
jgi:hypothetical protein